MVTKLVCTQISILIFIQLGFCQCNYKDFLKINHKHFSGSNKVLGLTYKSKTRYVSRILEQKRILQLTKLNDDSIECLFIDSFTRFYNKVNNNFLFTRYADSSSYESSRLSFPIDVRKWEIPGSVFFLRFLPVYQNKILFSPKYSKWKFEYRSEGMDTFIYMQRLRHSAITRRLFLNKDYELFRIEYEDHNQNNLQEKWSIDYNVFNDNSLLEIGQKLKYGPYRDFNKVVTNNSSAKRTSKSDYFDRIRLLDDREVKIDSLSDEYLIIDFWYLACQPCHLMHVDLDKIYLDIDTSKVKLYGCNRVDTKNDIVGYKNLKHLNVPEIDASAFKPFNFDVKSINIFPTVMIFDSKFNAIKVLQGYSKNNLIILKEFLKQNKLVKK